MESFATALRTLVSLILLPPLLLGVSIGAIVQLVLTRPSQRKVQWAYHAFSTTFVRIAGGPLLVSGAEHVDPKRAYVLVSNHESNLDPFAIMCALPELCIRFVIKRQIMNVPIFGNALAMSGNVTVDRTGSGDVKRLQNTLARRDPDVSLLFFAEGTRSRDGSFRPFKKGAFATAIAEQLPVLPIAVAGTYTSLPPTGARRLRRNALAVAIGEPISTEGLAAAARDELRERTQKRVAELRAMARARVRAAGDEPGGRD